MACHWICARRGLYREERYQLDRIMDVHLAVANARSMQVPYLTVTGAEAGVL